MTIDPVPPEAPVIKTRPPFFNFVNSMNCIALHPFGPIPPAPSSEMLRGLRATNSPGTTASSASTPPRLISTGGGMPPNTSSSALTWSTIAPVETTTPENVVSVTHGLLLKWGNWVIIAAVPWNSAAYLTLTRTSCGPTDAAVGSGRSFSSLSTCAGVPRERKTQPRMIASFEREMNVGWIARDK